MQLPILRGLGRTCGECNACCVVFGVEAVPKARGKRCPHLVDRGCGIYPERPDVCRTFKCLWLAGAFTEEERPDRSGVMVWRESGTRFGPVLLVADEGVPGGLARPSARALLAKIAQTDLLCVREIGAPRRYMGPPEELARIAPLLRRSHPSPVSLWAGKGQQEH